MRGGANQAEMRRFAPPRGGGMVKEGRKAGKASFSQAADERKSTAFSQQQAHETQI